MERGREREREGRDIEREIWLPTCTDDSSILYMVAVLYTQSFLTAALQDSRLVPKAFNIIKEDGPRSWSKQTFRGCQ